MEARALWTDRRVRIGAAVALAILLGAFVLLAMFPWGVLRTTIRNRLSTTVGRPVTIGAITRADAFSFTPTVVIRDVRIPQPAWAGAGDLAKVRDARVTFRAFPLLIGHFEPTAIAVDGLRLALRRDADGRENWRRSGSSSGGRTSIDRLVLSDTVVDYRDAKQHRRFTVAIAADPENGMRAQGRGEVRGNPVTVALRAPAPARSASDPWPFHARIGGDALNLDVRGTMARPFDTDHMVLTATADARDLKLVDAIIEAGLFGTQPVKLTAKARHDGGTWIVNDLSGTIGGSQIAGHVTARKAAGRTRIDGAITSDRLNFDDLSSDAGLARARAKEAQIGQRLVPDTPINLAKLDRLDGQLTVAVKRIVSSDGRSTLRSMDGTLAIDHGRLTVQPFRIGLSRGQITGWATIDQRDGRKVPLLRLDLRLAGSTIAALGGGGESVDGQVAGHARLTGSGDTIRAAVGRSDGMIGFVARDGTLPAKFASALGFDAGRALTTGEDERAGLRCVVAAFAVSRGTGRTRIFVADTSRSQMRGQGTLSFPSETLAIRLTGAPKQGSLLRLPGAAYLEGTLKQPDVVVPHQVKSVGNVLKAIGRTITGHQGPVATDVNCSQLEARALGR